MTLFEEVLSAPVAPYLAGLYLPPKLLLTFLPIVLPIFLAKDENP